jgi:hypothetical protein
MKLYWHDYKYFHYEKELAFLEVQNLLSNPRCVDNGKYITINSNDITNFIRLAYFSAFGENGTKSFTTQFLIENEENNSSKRQSTRYSAHGIHEYKGKFNPQIVRGILNILKVDKGSTVIDPFCGSGTTLVECSHMDINGIGFDINPMAVFISNAKIISLANNISILKEELVRILNDYSTINIELEAKEDMERNIYLKKWFNVEIYYQIEKLKFVIEKSNADISSLFLVIASNILRDYSLQDPNDLRIRRRKTPIPTTPIIFSFECKANEYLESIEKIQKLIGIGRIPCKSILADIREQEFVKKSLEKTKISALITSPPYATALPYIDTQRLSLVWLGLVKPNQLHTLETNLIGSRELIGVNKNELILELIYNKDNIPEKENKYCLELFNSLGIDDGFRRKAVPMLLYRYFSGMMKSFQSLRSIVEKNIPFALVMGRNHTVLGGKRFDINTTEHLVNIAESSGWKKEIVLPLQTYQRYGYHMNNAVMKEDLIIMKSI